MTPPDSAQWLLQIVWLLVLAVPIASVAWTVTHEEIFREPREYCAGRAENARRLVTRKFFYIFTCEYCFSHYVTAFFLLVTRYRLLLDDWRGYLVSFFALVAVANVYISAFGRLRQEVKSEKLEAKRREKVLERVERQEEEEETQSASSASFQAVPQARQLQRRQRTGTGNPRSSHEPTNALTDQRR